MDFKLESLIDKSEAGFLESFEKIIPEGLGVGSGIDALDADTVGFPSLLGELFLGLSDFSGELSSFFVFTVGVCALMAAASLISGRLSRIAEFAVMLISGVGMFTRLYPLVSKISETIGGVLSFFASFIPIMTGIIAYGGGSTAAASGAAGANMTLGIMGAFIIPLMNSAAALVFASGLLGTLCAGGGALSKRIKSFFMWLVGICSLLLLSSLALQSVLASAADTALMRGAKYAASGALPIVGGSVSSALGTLVTGVAYIKSTVGAGAVAVLLLLTLSPLAVLLAYRFIISLGEGLLDFLGVGFGAKILGAFKAAIDVLAAVFALLVTVLILETALLMKSGVSAL